MRVRSRGAGNPNGSGDACLAMGSGETEEYCITIAPAAACAGTPAPGNTTGPATICPTASFTLGLQNQPITSGNDYQWYVSTDGGVTYSPTGGNTPTLTTSQTVASMYYADVTCTSIGGGTASSTPISVAMSNFMTCYCTAGVGPTSAADSDACA
ncbi:MAG: hypothetical protein IPG69_02945 [Flavobacteriales bacterium]|nr:hypothetical protein [Flavobacteriales bacterium]